MGDSLTALVQRLAEARQPLEILPVSLPPYVPTRFDVTLEAVRAEPGRWGINPDSYPYEDDLEQAVLAAYSQEINDLQGTYGRVRTALEPCRDPDRLPGDRRDTACPACAESYAGVLTWYWDGSALRGRCSARCEPLAVAGAITAAVLQTEHQAQADADSEASAQALATTDLATALGAVPPQDWLIPGVVAADALHMVIGASGSNKTWLAMWMALCISQGIPWLTRPVRQARAMLVLLEGSVRDRRRRLEQLALGLGTTFTALGSELRVYPGELRLDDPASFAALAATVKATRCRFVVIDNLTEARDDVDENSSAALGAALRPLAQFAHSEEIAILLLHHDNAKGGVRGSSAIVQHADVVFKLRKRSPANNALIRIACIKDRFGAAIGEVAYRMRDQLENGIITAVTPSLELEEVERPDVPKILKDDPRLRRLLGLLPASSEELYAKMTPGPKGGAVGMSRTTIKSLRNRLEEDGIIHRVEGQWMATGKENEQ